MSSARPPMRVVIAPDKFKGSVTANEVADVLGRTLRDTIPGIQITSHPMADGGEGTVDTMLALGYEPVYATVRGPLHDSVVARYARSAQTAVIEMSAAAGLALLPGVPDLYSAANAGTYGVGELMADALDRGATRIVLGVGGSASTDGGHGLVRALGARVRTRTGAPVRPGGAALCEVASLDLSRIDARLADIDLVVACDVDNPLVGPQGAAAVYSLQKGADPSLAVRLDAALCRWADVVAAATTADRRAEPGLGAGGGTAFAAALLGGRLASGIDVIADLTNFDVDLESADLVIVGEGSLDTQSLRGKGPIGLAARAVRAGKRVIAVVGRNELRPAETRGAGLSQVYALTDLEPRPEVSMREAHRLLAEVGKLIARDVAATEPGVTPTVDMSASEWRAAILSTVQDSPSSDGPVPRRDDVEGGTTSGQGVT